MSEIIFQIIDTDGRMFTEHIDWKGDGSTHILEKIESTIDYTPEDKKVFVIIDMYSEVKEYKKKPSEKIIEEQVNEQKAKSKIREHETSEQGQIQDSRPIDQPLWDVA